MWCQLKSSYAINLLQATTLAFVCGPMRFIGTPAVRSANSRTGDVSAHNAMSHRVYYGIKPPSPAQIGTCPRNSIYADTTQDKNEMLHAGMESKPPADDCVPLLIQ